MYIYIYNIYPHTATYKLQPALMCTVDQQSVFKWVSNDFTYMYLTHVIKHTHVRVHIPFLVLVIFLSFLCKCGVFNYMYMYMYGLLHNYMCMYVYITATSIVNDSQYFQFTCRVYVPLAKMDIPWNTVAWRVRNFCTAFWWSEQDLSEEEKERAHWRGPGSDHTLWH